MSLISSTGLFELPWIPLKFSVYDITLGLLKWNGKMLVKWLRSVLEMFFMYLCPHWDRRCWSHCERHAYRDAQNMQDSYLNRLLRLNIYRYQSISRFDLSVMIYFWLIHPNFDKSLHSTLNCNFRFCDWIPRFHPRFLHRGINTNEFNS